jgi:hypothetical protein
MGINKATVVNAGIYVNPNSFTRNLAASYQILGTQINVLADVFTFGQRAPVLDIEDGRWSWIVPSGLAENGSINAYTKGLDATSIFSYAGTDYLGIDPLFLKTNPLSSNQKRPATIYETFINYKSYIDTSILQRTNALLAITANNGVDLSGVADGTILVSTGEEIDISNWRFIGDYPVPGSAALRMPGGNNITSTATSVSVDAPLIKFDTNAIAIASNAIVPVGALANYGRVYYKESDSLLHLVDHAGVDSAIVVGSGWTHREVAVGSGSHTITMSDNSTTYLVNTISGSCFLTLPLISGLEDGWQITIADIYGLAGTNNISITPATGPSLNKFVGYGTGNSLVIDTSDGLVTLQVTGNGWLILYSK